MVFLEIKYIMRKVILITLVFFYSVIGHATEQEPDYLYYDGIKLKLSIGWGHLSPLETYFYQNEIKPPFEMINTGNYRGHVAVWEIKDSILFLKEVQVRDKKYKPEKFNIRSKSDSLSLKGRVLADWFTGVIIGEMYNEKTSWKIKESYFFYVKYGRVVNKQVITANELQRIKKLTENDTLSKKLIAKISMLELNSNYISYYFRLIGSDTITFDNKGGKLGGKSILSPIMEIYDNDHLKWPYNWENFEKNGAPHCTWCIKNDSIFLKEVELHTGTGFYSIDKYPIQLTELFPNKMRNNAVFSDWISGIYVVRHGGNEEDKRISGHYEFKIKEFTFMRVEAGIVIEKYTVPIDFDFINIPPDTDEGLKNIINDYRK